MGADHSGTTAAGSPADPRPDHRAGASAGARLRRVTRRRPHHPRREQWAFEFGGLLGLVILIADIWAIIQVFNSSVSTAAKLGWTLFIVLPILGLVIWFFIRPRPRGTALV